ncbi:acyl-CoA dehydrogenase [Nocardioides sp. HDW12B]|uniref:acyl-CoA dehydrogenase family protein n=1 Tax=Nocardioides sp. HDW12B TaxID=2714939 RepID=UPI00140D3D50|nr:acyl-CoA dehydrogenase family protein [Nocardioides sp. HDW12B]QIK68095.1 acyl-CoA dehydrogenase [Nocardioides sp. HDW12B]
MDFEYDDEQQALRDAVRGLLTKAYGDFEKRRTATRGERAYDPDVWRQLAEMGVLGLPFAEADGGMGAGPLEVGIVAEELGRVLAPEPFLTAVVLAGGAVAAAGTDAQRAALLEPLAAGESLLAWAHDEPGHGYTSSASATKASQEGDGWMLTGTKEPVVSGEHADVLVVTAALPDGPSTGSGGAGTGLFTVAADAAGLTRTGYPTHDGGRAALITFDGTPAEALGEGADATAVVERVLDQARVAAAAEALGLISEALSATRDYLTSRKQFGVTLNTFQALTFRASDMYVDLELTRSLVLWAAMVLDAGSPEEASVAASRAALQVATAGKRVGQEAIQLHGGIGVTAEYSVGHRLSRLRALEAQLGDARLHTARLAGRVASYGEVDPLP